MIGNEFYRTGGTPQLGVSPLSWINEVLHDLGEGTTAEQCLSEAAKAGFTGVELSRIFPRNATDLKALLGKHHLQLISGWHDGFLTERDVEAELEAVHAHASLLRDCGAKVMVYGECGWMTENALDVPLSARKIFPPEQMKAYADRLTRFADALYSEYGLRLAYHHHLMMVAETLDEVRSLITSCGASVGLLLDTGHATAAGFDYSVLLNEFGSRIGHIHLKDVRAEMLQRVRAEGISFNNAVRAGLFTVPGDGMTDYAPLADFIASAGYCGWLVVEAEQDPTVALPAETVSRARQFVSANILNIAQKEAFV